MTRPVALVSGASRGLGREVARRLVAEGYTVLAGMRNTTPLPSAEVIPLDVTDEIGILAAADAVKGLVPGMLQNFALPFRHHRQTSQPLKPTAGALVERQWDQPAAISRRCNLSDCV